MHLQVRDTGQQDLHSCIRASSRRSSRLLRFIVFFWQLPPVNSRLINNRTGNIIAVPRATVDSHEASMHRRLQQCNCH